MGSRNGGGGSGSMALIYEEFSLFVAFYLDELSSAAVGLFYCANKYLNRGLGWRYTRGDTG